MMKRKLNEPKGSSPKGTPSGETKKVRKASGYFGDPRLIPRVRQYLKAHSQKTISPSEIAEDLQRQFGEYGRKKKNAFYKMVEKAYQIIRESDREPADSMSRLEEKHLQKKAATALSCSESDDVESIDSDASFSDENAAYVQYNDSNAMNNMMSQLYKSTPTTSRTSSPKPNTSTTVEDYSPAQKSNDACITIDDSSDSDNPDSARRDKGLGNYQAFCIDRSGQNSMYMKPHNPPIMLPMMDEIRFLPQNMVINAGINAGLLPQHSHTSRDIPQVISPTEAVRKRNVDNVSIISDVTENSIADKSVNKSAKKTPHKISKKKKEKQVNKEEKQKGPELQTSNVTFADIGGNEHTLMDICKLLVHMKHPEVYMQLGVTPPRGFLLHGPPGCGKTLLANAIAGELSLPLIKIAATEVVSGVSGESEEKVRDLFDKAVAAAPSILFIDEIDAITPKRETASKDMERRIVAQLLSCMDDLNSRGDAPVLVIGATNRPDSLDPALRRAGRFDREISLGIPDEAARGRILQVLCRTLTLDDDFDCKFLSRNTPGFVGADLMALTREAAMIAVNRVFNQLQNASKCLPDKTQQSCDNIKVSPCETAKSNQASGEVIMNGAEKKSEETQDDKKDSGNSVHDKDEKENGIEETENMKGNDGKDNKGSDSSHCDGENKQTSEQVQTLPSQDTDCVMDVTEEIPSTSTASTVSQTGQEDLKLVLQWLKDHPPLTENQLKDITITMQDFKDALKFVQPSAKREGFATIPGVTWNDIGALHHIREELQLAIMAPVRHAQEFKDLGLTQAQGILLAGPPGCGKTLLAKAIANESGINFISVKGPELLNMYVGESERAVRQVFQRGRNSAPCVIFFDEIDSLCPKRSLSGESGSSVRVVNQLLTEMDGLEDRKQVFIMAATNRPDIIDPAILRPGRLDKLLYVGLPSEADRHDILKTISKNGTKPRLSSDVDLQAIANDKRCQGFTGADLAALVREASLCALKSIIKSKSDSAHSPEVNTQHFEEAFVKVKPSVSTQDQKKYEDMRNGIVK